VKEDVRKQTNCQTNIHHVTEKYQQNGQRLAYLLSQNSRHHHYNETEDKWFMRHLITMMDEINKGLSVDNVH
jgi:hypothetical protein